jgi:hypothetical protein
MYQITKYSFDRARELGVLIKPSNKKWYKIDVFDKDLNYITSVGDDRYSDYPHYIESHNLEYAENRRRLYRLRHKNNNSIRGFFALNILW